MIIHIPIVGITSAGRNLEHCPREFGAACFKAMAHVIGGQPIHESVNVNSLCSRFRVHANGIYLCSTFFNSGSISQSCIRIALSVTVDTGFAIGEYDHDFLSLDTVSLSRNILQHLPCHLHAHEGCSTTVAGKVSYSLSDIGINTTLTIFTGRNILPSRGIVIIRQLIAGFSHRIYVILCKQSLIGS